MVDIIRGDLGGLLVGGICAPNERLPVITLAAELEDMVLSGMQDPISGMVLIEPDLARSIGERVAQLIADLPVGSIPALIVQPRARRPLASLLKIRAPGCLVLSINELPATQPIEVISIICGESEQGASGHGTDAPEAGALAA